MIAAIHNGLPEEMIHGLAALKGVLDGEQGCHIMSLGQNMQEEVRASEE